jgi:hypothetical protein
MIDHIEDPDSALYLSQFGLQPIPDKGDPNNIENIFISDRDAKHLTVVTDDSIYSEAHRLVCREIAAYDDPAMASEWANAIMDDVEKKIKPFAKSRGITLDSIGWADNWDFDPEVQMAMNQKFNAEMVKDSLEVLERNAHINLLEGLAAGFRNKMPGTLFWGAPSLLDAVVAGTAMQGAGAVGPVRK